MKRVTLIGVFMVVLALLLAPTWVNAMPTWAFTEQFTEPTMGTLGPWTWADDLAMTIASYKNAYPGVNFDPFIGQMEVARALYNRGDVEATRTAMNHLMDMLEAREGGIPAVAADEIYDHCYRVTPAAYHDVWRHFKFHPRDQFGPDEPGFGEAGG